jgi:hypothetical protein
LGLASKKQVASAVLAFLPGVLVLWAFGPCVPALWRERAFAEDVKAIAEKTSLGDMSLRRKADAELRRTIQALARARGFSLALDQAFLDYGDADLADTFEGPKRIGYTLPIKLRLFGFHEYTLLAVRVFRAAR